MKKLIACIICLVLVISVISCRSTDEKILKDDLGEEIFLSNTPQRIISLTPNITEILFFIGVGNRVVARTSFCNYPSETESIPIVGDMMNLSVETILDFDPDLVIANRMIPIDIINSLKSISSKKITVVAFDPNSIETLIETIDKIAFICGVPSNTSTLINKIEEIEFDKSDKIVYSEIWGDPPMTFGENTYGADLIKKVGGINLGNSIPGDFPTTTHESIIDLDPDVIIIPEPYQDSVEDIKNREGYDVISAVRNDKVYSVNADLLMRPSPRVVDVLEILKEIVSD